MRVQLGCNEKRRIVCEESKLGYWGVEREREREMVED